MADIAGLLDIIGSGKAQQLDAADVKALEEAVRAATGLPPYMGSAAGAWGNVYLAARGADNERLVLRLFKGEGARSLGPYAIETTPWSLALWRELGEHLPFLVPGKLGQATSAGLGDRLGMATPGHASAARKAGIAPVFAQQSMREMSRTGRTPEDVVIDAAWGAWLSGWRQPWGADADHLKTTEDVDTCAAAGFVMYTIDPGAHVDDAAGDEPADVVKGKLDGLPWGDLETTQAECRSRHVTSPDDEEAFARAAAKYARAVAHTARVARHVEATIANGNFEIEVSVDETNSPTSPFEHRFVATELRRMGVVPNSLAVRFVGDFEKGIDYKGDLAVLAKEAVGHADVARDLGPYKLSIHSGSDKFSAYPCIAEATRGAVHLKTAGTSWLEALRAIANADPELFRKIAAVARDSYEEDRKSYHVSGSASDVPPAADISADRARALLDHVGARQVFHVTYGSVLSAPAHGGGTLGAALKKCLGEHEQLHWDTVERHIAKHLEPFAKSLS